MREREKEKEGGGGKKPKTCCRAHLVDILGEAVHLLGAGHAGRAGQHHGQAVRNGAERGRAVRGARRAAQRNGAAAFISSRSPPPAPHRPDPPAGRS